MRTSWTASMAVLAVTAALVTGCGDAAPPPLAIGAASTTAAADSLARSDGMFQPISGYRVDGELPATPTEAPVQRWDAAAVDEQAVTALVAALGFADAPTRRGDDWFATGPVGRLAVYGAAGNPWVYARADRLDCPPLPLDGWAGPGTAVACDAPAIDPQPVAVPSDEATTLRLSAPVFAAVGLPSATTAVDGVAGVDPVVDGLPTRGITTSVTVSAAAGGQPGVETASGWLGQPDAGAVYPLITAAAAAQQLQSLPQPAMPEICRTDLPDCGILPAREAVITGADLGLLFTWEGEEPLLVPAWIFTVEDQADGPVVVAVAPEYLTDPTASGSPGSVEPGTSGSGTSGSAGSDPGSGSSDLPGTPSPVEPPTDPGPVPEPTISVTSALVDRDGRTVTLLGWGGDCAEYRGEAKETPAEVFVVITATPTVGPDQACTAIAREVAVKVGLSDPLAGRTLIDAPSGAEVEPVAQFE